MSIIILFAILLIILLWCIATSHKGLLTPQFAYTVSFVGAVGLSIPYIKDWDLELSIKTFGIICGGGILFTFASKVTDLIISNFTGSRLSPNIIATYNYIHINRWKLLLYAMLQIFLVIYIFTFMQNYAGGTDITSVIFNYYMREDRAYGTPTIISFLRGMSYAAVYFWIYLLIHSILFKYKTHRLLLILNIILGLALSMMTGSRGGAIQTLASAIPMYYFLNAYKNHWQFKISFKTVIKLVILILIILLTFPTIGKFVGRGEAGGDSDLYYVAVYIAAPIKNLDLLIRRGIYEIYQRPFLTIRGIAEYIFIMVTGNPLYVESKNIVIFPFNEVNGKFLGNVATVYANYLFDGRFIGIIFYTILMAILCQFSFHYAISGKTKIYARKISMGIILYAIIFVHILFSFFSSRFYENLFNEQFLKQLLYWFILYNYIFRLKVL
jgi:hypothetical protein